MKREKNAFVSSKDRSLAEGGTFLEDIIEVLNGRMESLWSSEENCVFVPDLATSTPSVFLSPMGSSLIL